MAVAPDEIGYPTEKEDNQNTFRADVRTHNRFRRIIFQSLRNCQLLKSGGYAQNRVVSAKAILPVNGWSTALWLRAVLALESESKCRDDRHNWRDKERCDAQRQKSDGCGNEGDSGEHCPIPR